MLKPLIKATDLAVSRGWKDCKKKLFKAIHERFGGQIRMFVVGGAAGDKQVAQGLRALGFGFIQGYGLTETSPILTLNPNWAFKDESAGKALPGIELKINHPNDEGIGEIWVKAGSVMLGYYKNIVATQEVFEDGWFKTGDIGFIDRDGYLYIRGRAKNVIIANNGKNVYPEEVEEALLNSDFILEALVYGKKDEKHKEIIAAQIVPDAESIVAYADENKLEVTETFVSEIIKKEIDIVNSSLTSYKRVQTYILRDHEFEKTTTQKIKRYSEINNNE